MYKCIYLPITVGWDPPCISASLGPIPMKFATLEHCFLTSTWNELITAQQTVYHSSCGNYKSIIALTLGIRWKSLAHRDHNALSENSDVCKMLCLQTQPRRYTSVLVVVFFIIIIICIKKVFITVKKYLVIFFEDLFREAGIEEKSRILQWPWKLFVLSVQDQALVVAFVG